MGLFVLDVAPEREDQGLAGAHSQRSASVALVAVVRDVSRPATQGHLVETGVLGLLRVEELRDEQLDIRGGQGLRRVSGLRQVAQPGHGQRPQRVHVFAGQVVEVIGVGLDRHPQRQQQQGADVVGTHLHQPGDRLGLGRSRAQLVQRLLDVVDEEQVLDPRPGPVGIKQEH